MSLRHAPAAEIDAGLWIAPVSYAAAMGARTGPADIAVPAYANAGRWVVECPDCGGAQLACRSDQRFMCNECANAVVDGLWRPVLWPDQADAVEAVLEVRPVRNQNWMPGEALADLVAENVDHELPAVLRGKAVKR